MLIMKEFCLLRHPNSINIAIYNLSILLVYLNKNIFKGFFILFIKCAWLKTLIVHW